MIIMSTIEAAARALAFRWSHCQEEPPDYIDQLMTELTAALQEATEAGDRARAKCLSTAINNLARGVAEHKRQANPGVHTAPLERAKAEIRLHNRWKESAPKEKSRTPGERVPLCQRAGRDRRLDLTPRR
jgi:hypothetical protein